MFDCSPLFFFGLSWARVCVCVYVHRVYLSSFPRPQTAHTFDNKSRTRFLFCDKVPINYRNSPHKKIVCYRIQCMYNLYGIFVSQCSLCCRYCHSTRAQWALTHTHTQAKRTTTTNKTRVTQRMRTPNKKIGAYILPQQRKWRKTECLCHDATIPLDPPSPPRTKPNKKKNKKTPPKELTGVLLSSTGCEKLNKHTNDMYIHAIHAQRVTHIRTSIDGDVPSILNLSSAENQPHPFR